MEQKESHVARVATCLGRVGYDRRLIEAFICSEDMAIYVDDGWVDEEELLEDFEDYCIDLRRGLYA